MTDSREALIKQISKANVMRRHCDRIADAVKKTKNNWHDKLQNKLEIMRRKAQRGGEKERTAYLQLVAQKKLLN